MFLHKSTHHLLPSSNLPNKSSFFNSDNTLTPRQSPMTEIASQTIMPAMLINEASALPHHTPDPLQHLPGQAYASSKCSYVWPRSERSGTFDHTSFGCRVQQTSSAIPLRASFENAESQVKREDNWNLGSHQQLQAPFLCTPSSFNDHSLKMDQGLSTAAQFYPGIRSPILPTSAHASQLPSRMDSTNAGSFEVMGGKSRYNPLPSYTFDSAPSFGSSLYATSSALPKLTRPKIHRPFHRSEQLEALDSETESERKQSELPYAKLIYRALMDAPEHQMVLKDIYGWIAQNTDKAKDPAFKGWQNSVRHNLSMNAVCFALC